MGNALNDIINANIIIPGVNGVNDKIRAFFSRTFFGAGSPEGSVTAVVGSQYMDTTAGVLYTKQTGSGNTGWVSTASATSAALPIAGAGATAATDMVNAKVTGDTVDRLVINADGSMEFGPGSGASDLTVSRASAGLLSVARAPSTGGATLAVRSDFQNLSIQRSDGTTQIGYIERNSNDGTGLRVVSSDKLEMAAAAGKTIDLKPGTNVTIADAAHIVLGSTTGTKIGTATTQKLGFFNATPVVQQSAVTAPAATAATNASPFGYTTQAQADAVVTAVRALITTLQTLGLTA